MAVRRDAEKRSDLGSVCAIRHGCRVSTAMTATTHPVTVEFRWTRRREWPFTVLLMTLLCFVIPSTTHGQIAKLESDRDIAAYLRQAWRLKRARIQPPPPPSPPWSCKIAPRISIDTSRAREGPAIIRGVVYRADSVPAIAASQRLASPTLRVEQTTIAATGARDGTFEFNVPAGAIGTGRSIAVIIGAVGHANARAELRIVAGARVHIDVPLCTDRAIVREYSTSDHWEWGRVGRPVGLKTFTINAQADSVDEGGIIKRLDRFFIVLRRGRLFSIDTRQRVLRHVATIDAFAPWIDPGHASFDELIVHGDRVIVLGFDYNANATIVGAFRLDARGGLRHERTFALTGAAHSSSRDGVSRLVESRFVLYSQSDVPFDSAGAANALPLLREWRARDSSRASGSVNHSQRVYRPVGAAALTPVDAMHTVTTCDLARAEFACESTTVLASSGSAHFVSRTAVYISTSTWSTTNNRSHGDSVSAQLVRIPLDGQAATSVAVNGVAIDQLSFLERDKTLHMVLRGEGLGARQWLTQQPGETLALLSVPVEQLRVGLDPRPLQYRIFGATHSSDAVRHRFVGDALLYGAVRGSTATATTHANLMVVPLENRSVQSIPLEHDIERIEAMGDDALVIGRDSIADLHLSGVRLNRRPMRVQHEIIKDREHVYGRSNPFFYRPDENRTRTGVIALPITRADHTGRAFQNRVDAVHYLRNTGTAFKPLGELSSQPIPPYDDCKASCEEWYGQSRSIFLDGRSFALVGYELAEGAVVGSRIVEVRRINFSPTTKPAR